MTTEIVQEPKVLNDAFPFTTTMSRNDATQIAAFLAAKGASFMVYYAGEKAETTLRISQHAAELLAEEGVLAK